MTEDKEHKKVQRKELRDIHKEKMELAHKEKDVKRGNFEMPKSKGGFLRLLFILGIGGFGGWFIGKTRGNVLAGVISGIIIAMFLFLFLKPSEKKRLKW